MENYDENDYQAIIIWNCQQFYYNGMMQEAKRGLQKYPESSNLKISLAVSYILINRAEESLREANELNQQENTPLASLLIQNYAHRLNGSKERGIITQLEAKIREERRKANCTSLAKASMVLFLLKKTDKAKEYAEKAFKSNPNDLEVLITNGWIDVYCSKEKTNFFKSMPKEYSRQLGVSIGTGKLFEHEKSHDKAILIYNALIVRYPKLCLPLIEKMMNQIALKDWDQTLETANRILTIDSNNLDALKAKIIVSLCYNGDYNEGCKIVQLFFRNLSICEPKNVDVFVDCIQLFLTITNHDPELLTDLSKINEKVIHQNSNSSEPMIQLGNIYILMNKLKEAEHWYRNAVRINESSFQALMGLANCQILDPLPGAFNLARQQLDFLIEIQSTNSLDPKLQFMSSKLCINDSPKALNYIEIVVKSILENIEGLPYGYKYLKELNPDFCLEIVNEYLLHSPTISVMDVGIQVADIGDDKPIISLVKKVTEACPGYGRAFLMLAKTNIQNGNFDEALKALKKLLDTIDPTNASAHLLMAQIFTRQKDFESASQSLEVGLSYNFKVRDDPLFHLITGIIEKESENYEKCIDSLRTAMDLLSTKNRKVSLSSSDKATLYLELISAYSKLKKFDEASALMSEAKLQFVNTVEEGRIKIGNADLCLETGDIDKAINYLNDIQPGESYFFEAHTKLANIYLYNRKDRLTFAKCFRELVEHCPDSKTYSLLGDAYIAIQEPDRAIEAYEESLKHNPTDKSLARKMGKALVKTHQYQRAINFYKESIKQKNCTELKLDMAELFMRMKQFDKAEATLVQELQDNRSFTDLLSLEIRIKKLLILAKVREKSGNIPLAISTLKEAKENQIRCIQRTTIGQGIIEQKEVLAKICLMMAEHSTALRDFDSAIGYYKDTLQHKPTDIKALLSLAKLYMQVNDLDKCAQSCTALLNADPNNEAASVMMADLAFRKVDFDTAAFHFKQLLLRQPTYWTALARLIEVSRRTGNIDDLDEWLSRAETANGGSNQDAGFYYCAGLLDWRTGKLNSALRHFNAARRDPEWGQQAIYNMIEICLDPDDDSALSSEAFNEEDAEYQDSRVMALNTAKRLLQELNPKGSPHEMLTHRLLGNFYLLATKIKTNIERALQDCTSLASQDTLRDHVGPALGISTAHILLKQTPRARNHLKRVSKNVWTFEDAEYLERCWLLLSDIYVQSNKYDLANELLRKILQHNATCVRAHELLGYIAEKEQNYREAATRYGLAWNFGGKTKLTSGYKLAYNCLKSKKYADAIEACNEVLKQNPEFPKIRKEILEKSINNIRT